MKTLGETIPIMKNALYGRPVSTRHTSTIRTMCNWRRFSLWGISSMWLKIGVRRGYFRRSLGKGSDRILGLKRLGKWWWRSGIIHRESGCTKLTCGGMLSSPRSASSTETHSARHTGRHTDKHMDKHMHRLVCHSDLPSLSSIQQIHSSNLVCIVHKSTLCNTNKFTLQSFSHDKFQWINRATL